MTVAMETPCPIREGIAEMVLVFVPDDVLPVCRRTQPPDVLRIQTRQRCASRPGTCNGST
jgi:hypothetical protein